MNIEDLKLKANDLESRFAGINGWIEQNPHTDPNFCEIVDCMVEYGKLQTLYGEYYAENGYPEIGEEGRPANHYEIAVVSPEVRDAYGELKKMYALRSGSEFFKDETVKKFMTELTYRVTTAEYRIPADEEIDAAKKRVLCQTAAIYFYIWQTQQREPGYKYDNESEWNELGELYALYKGSEGVQEVITDVDNSVYEGPQFGQVIENMMAGIEKNYKFAADKKTDFSK